jgi:Fe2+ or Zn2+ uptake regulation protein
VAHLDARVLVQALREAGLRVTKPRRAVCAVLAASHDDHLSASDLRERAEREAGSRIDPSTIYRTIDALERTGHLHHVHLGHGPAIIHLSGMEDHHHLVCEVCGHAVDVPMSEVRAAVGAVGRRYGFTIDSAHFALAGRCADHETNGEPAG